MRKTTSTRLGANRTRGLWTTLIALCGTALVSAPVSAQQTVAERLVSSFPSPEDVLRSAMQHHPEILAAELRMTQASARLQAARGGFDPVLSARASMRFGDSDAYYQLGRVDIDLTQPTPFWGAELNVGYRLFTGADDRFPSYYSPTQSAGELSAGIRVPLWRDGPIDSRRAARTVAEFGIGRAAASQQSQQLSVERKALSKYFALVAALERLRVSLRLEELANARLSQVQARVDVGALAEIEALEARRSQLRRRSATVSSRRYAQEAALELSLYFRDDSGRPLLVDVEQLPTIEASLPEERARNIEQVEAEIPGILECHPAVRSIRLQRESATVSRDLARARRGPRLDLQFDISRDFGEEETQLTGTVMQAGLRFSMPLGLRTERGNLERAEAELAVLEQRLRLREDVLAVEARDIGSQSSAAHERHEIAEELLRITEELAEAERARFREGATTLMVVNLREQAMAEAAVAVVNANRDIWLAHLRWRALRGACIGE